MVFNKEAYLKGKLNPSGAGFWKAPPGLYPCKLKSVSYGKAKDTPSVGCSFIWTIDPGAEEFAGKDIFQYINLEDQSGAINDIGYSNLCGMFNDFMYIPDEELLASDTNRALQPLIGSEAIISVEPNEKKPEYPKISVQRVLLSSVSDQIIQTEQIETNLSSIKPSSNGVIEAGNYVGFRDKWGEHTGTAKLVTPAGIVVTKSSDKKDQTVAYDDCWKLGDTEPIGLPMSTAVVEKDEPLFEEDLPVEDSIELEIGMTVKGTFQDKQIVGVIKDFLEHNGEQYVKIAHGTKVYPVKLDSIEMP